MINLEVNDKLKEIFDKSPIGIIIYDKKGKLIDINQSAQKIGMISKLGDILDKNIFDIPNIAIIKRKLLEEGLIEFQAPFYLKNNEDDSKYNFKNSEKVLINWNVSATDSGFLVQIQDIKDYKNSKKLLKRVKKNFIGFFEDDLTGDFIATIKGKIILCNPSFVEIYGFDNREMALKSEISEFNPNDWINLD